LQVLTAEQHICSPALQQLRRFEQHFELQQMQVFWLQQAAQRNFEFSAQYQFPELDS